MTTAQPSRHRNLIGPIVVILGAIFLFGYGTVALVSQDFVWFLNRVDLPDPQRILVRVDGQESELTPATPGYDLIVAATREALSGFRNWSPGSMGLSENTLAEYQERGTQLELYFAEPVPFHLPFNEGQPTALLFPLEGRHGGQGYVFRGKRGRWWAGQLTVNDPQPLMDALRRLGFAAAQD